MNRFAYKATDASGKILKGTIEGDDRKDIVLSLKKDGLYPIDVWPVKSVNFSFEFLNKLKRISDKEVLVFIMQLSTMIKSGIPL